LQNKAKSLQLIKQMTLMILNRLRGEKKLKESRTGFDLRLSTFQL
jgi:hypothetical protein